MVEFKLLVYPVDVLAPIFVSHVGAFDHSESIRALQFEQETGSGAAWLLSSTLIIIVLPAHVTTPASPSPAPTYTYSLQFEEVAPLADGLKYDNFFVEEGYLYIEVSENFGNASVVIELRASASVYGVSATYTYNLEIYYCSHDSFTDSGVDPTSSPEYIYDGSTLEFQAYSTLSHTRVEECTVQFTCVRDDYLSPDFCSFFDTAQGRWSFSTTD